jgi:hypothetical protein
LAFRSEKESESREWLRGTIKHNLQWCGCSSVVERSVVAREVADSISANHSIADYIPGSYNGIMSDC